MPTDVLDFHADFLDTIRDRQSKRRKLFHPSTSTNTSTTAEAKPTKDERFKEMHNYVKEEESLRNDYMIRYIKTGEWNGNWVKGISEAEECAEYPKLRRLRDLKKQLCNTHTHPPFHLSFNTTTTSPRSLTDLLSPYHFDVILLTPPKDYTWPEITAIPVRLLSADPSFVFIWIGKTDHDGLERGREALMKWGFRRCEEIIWVKSNKKRKMRGRGFGLDGLEEEVAVDGENGGDDQPKGLLVNQKEHCLMGIRGTVRRKTDNFFVHCNVDTDVIVYEEDENDSSPTPFPPQLYTLIENFCLGTRRLELFSPKSTARRGWVTVGPDDIHTNNGPVPTRDKLTEQVIQEYDAGSYGQCLERLKDEMGRYVLPQDYEIDNIRPKSPVRPDHPNAIHRKTHADRPHRGRNPNDPGPGNYSQNQNRNHNHNNQNYQGGSQSPYEQQNHNSGNMAMNPMAMMQAMQAMNMGMGMGMGMPNMGMNMGSMGGMNMGMMPYGGGNQGGGMNMGNMGAGNSSPGNGNAGYPNNNSGPSMQIHPAMAAMFANHFAMFNQGQQGGDGSGR